MGKKSGFNIKSLLNTGIHKNSFTEETAEQANFNIEYISIYDLIPSKGNFYHITNIEELKNSIEIFGVQQNLIVSSLEAGKFKVIAGHRRRRACISLVDEGKSSLRKYHV